MTNISRRHLIVSGIAATAGAAGLGAAGSFGTEIRIGPA